MPLYPPRLMPGFSRNLMSTRRNFLVSSCGAAFSAAATANLLSAPIPMPSVARPVLGLTLPLTGVQAEVASDLQDGYRMAAAAHGGIFDIAVLDDYSMADKAAENVRLFAETPGVLALSGIVGTPHAELALPFAVEQSLPVVGIRSGARSLRKGQSGVFHFRSTYESELERLASIIAGSHSERVEVLFSEDSFGKGSAATLTAKLQELGIAHGEPVPMMRNGENLNQAVDELAARTKKGGHVSIVLLVIAGPLIRATTRLRSQHQVLMPIYGMSHVANRRVSLEKINELSGLGVMLAFPLPRYQYMAIGQSFKDACVKARTPELIESLTCYEGFFYGSIFASALKDAGGNAATRQKLVQRLSLGVKVGGMDLRPNSKNEGYHFIDLAYKHGKSGKLYT